MPKLPATRFTITSNLAGLPTLVGASGGEPRWNFYKYVIDRQGNLLGSFPSQTLPDDPALLAALEQALASAPLP